MKAARGTSAFLVAFLPAGRRGEGSAGPNREEWMNAALD